MNFEWAIKVLFARSRLMLKIFGSVMLLALALIILLPRQWTAQTVLAVNEKANDPVSGMPVAAYLIPGYLDTQVDIATSHKAALKVVDALGLDKTVDARRRFKADTDGAGTLRDWLADQLLKRLEVKPARESSLITLDYTARDPKLAVLMANSFAQAYMNLLVDMQTTAAGQQSLVFQQQLIPLRDNLEKTQQRLAAFQRQAGIVVDESKHLDLASQELNDLGTQLVSAESATYDAQARASGDDRAPDVQNNPMIQAQETALAQSKVKLQFMAGKYGPNHPLYQQALALQQANQQQLNAMTRQYVGSLKQGAANSALRQAGLQAAFAHEKSALLVQKEQGVLRDALQKEVEDAQRAYSQVLQRFSDTRLASHVSQTDTFVLKPATEPVNPYGPQPVFSLLAALLLGVMLAICGAFMAEMLDRRVHVSQDVETLLELPVLALVEYGARPEARRLARLALRLKSLVGARAS